MELVSVCDCSFVFVAALFVSLILIFDFLSVENYLGRNMHSKFSEQIKVQWNLYYYN